jgi:diguanylate cyclase (GGDEF)-like protein
VTHSDRTRIQRPRCRVELTQGKGEGITTAVVVAAFGAICVIGVLVALWAVLRRPLDERVATALQQVDERLAGIAEQISAASRREGELDTGLGDAIGSTIELGDVLQRTLAAAEALTAVDGSRVSVRRPDGMVETAVHGLVVQSAESTFAGPPDGAQFVSADALRTGLVVPLGPDGSGSLAVYSRLTNAFDTEAVTVLAAIARRAAPAVQNAFRYLEVQERAATDSRTGLGSASAFEEALSREISAARRHGRPLCLIQIDLDDFGSINKDHSLTVGDEVLTEFGVRVRSTIRGSDSAFRNSGGADEFFLILPDTTREYAELLYGRLRFEMAARPFGEVGAVTMSSGLAECRADDTEDSLRQRVGSTQRMAKKDGKNRLVTDADRRVAAPE